MNAPTVRALLLGPLLGMALCAACVDGVRADDLGRLFTSVADRARIDALRSGKQPDATDAAPGTDRVVLNGTLRGSDGKRLVWLNGAPVKPGGTSNMSLLRDGRVQLTWRDGAKILKPGQGIDRTSGKIFENHTPVAVPAAKESVAETAPETPPETKPASEPVVAAAAEAKPAVAVEPKAK